MNENLSREEKLNSIRGHNTFRSERARSRSSSIINVKIFYLIKSKLFSFNSNYILNFNDICMISDLLEMFGKILIGEHLSKLFSYKVKFQYIRIRSGQFDTGKIALTSIYG
jgi:hypothetical protein